MTFLAADVLQDPFGYVPDPRPSSATPPPTSESWPTSRPRSPPKPPEKQNKENADPFPHPEYYSKILTKVDKFLKVAADKIVRRESGNGEEEVRDDDDEQSDDRHRWDSECDEELMLAKQFKCQVGTKICFHFLRIYFSKIISSKIRV